MRKALRFLTAALLLFVLVSAAIVLAFRWVDPPTSAFMLRERLMASNADATFELKHHWVDWQRIAAPMKVAVIAAEDQTFADHHGFDLKSIGEALRERERGRVRGASTISQQVAKNLFLWPGQNWLRKGLEAYLTVLIEALWPKRRILEVHLNVAEFGRGVFGVGAASEIYFRKQPAGLSIHEAALLAAVLPNPKRLRAGSPSPYVRSRQRWIMTHMRQLGGAGVLQKLD